MNSFVTPMALAGLGTTEILIILGILILLFGAKKLPELARGSGRALRIFKAETKGLADDDEQPSAHEPKPIDSRRSTTAETSDPTVRHSPSDTER